LDFVFYNWGAYIFYALLVGLWIIRTINLLYYLFVTLSLSLSLSLSCSFSFDLLLLSTRSCFSKKKQVATVEREVDGDLVTLCLDLPAVITRVHVHSIGFTCSYDWSYIYSLRSCQNSLVVAEARGKLYIGQLKTLEKRLMVWFPS
jgi:hypothetical protein